MCRKKSEGRLGFKDMKAMNIALLAKQCWRLIKNHNSFKGKYFRYYDVLVAKVGNNPS